MRGRSRGVSLAAAIALAMTMTMMIGTGCLRPRETAWAASLTDLELEQAFQGLPEEGAASLIPLSEIFYSRIISRRFNSRATFEDPSVREFFPSVAAYSDYYAALVDALDRAFIEFNRPTTVELLEINRTDRGSIRLELRFVGEDDRPLRGWKAALVHEDEWVWRDRRWWIVPGKV